MLSAPDKKQNKTAATGAFTLFSLAAAHNLFCFFFLFSVFLGQLEAVSACCLHNLKDADWLQNIKID